MSRRGVQIRALVSDYFAYVLVALLVLTAVSGVLTYETHADPGTETKTVNGSKYTATTVYNHRADVKNGTPGLPTQIENRGVYLRSPSPVLEGSYEYRYRASDGGNLSVTVDQTLVLRSADDEREYWKVTEKDLGVTTNESVEPGETVTAPFKINVTEAAIRWDEIDKTYGGTPGEKEIRIRSQVYLSGVRNGDPVEKTRVAVLSIDVKGNLYYVEKKWKRTYSDTEVREITVPATYGPLRKTGAPLAFVLSLGGVIALVAVRRENGFELTASERAWLDYRNAADEFEEWVSVGKIPEKARFQTTIRVEELKDLVDIAVDSNRRVIRDDSRDLYAVLLEDTVYTFEPPERPGQYAGLEGVLPEMTGVSSVEQLSTAVRDRLFEDGADDTRDRRAERSDDRPASTPAVERETIIETGSDGSQSGREPGDSTATTSEPTPEAGPVEDVGDDPAAGSDGSAYPAVASVQEWLSGASETASRRLSEASAVVSRLLSESGDRAKRLRDRVRDSTEGDADPDDEKSIDVSANVEQFVSVLSGIEAGPTDEWGLRDKLAPGGSNPEWPSEAVLASQEDRIGRRERIQYQLLGDAGIVHEDGSGTETIEQPADGHSVTVVTDQNLVFATVTAESETMTWAESIAYTDVMSVDVDDGLFTSTLTVEVGGDETYEFKAHDGDGVRPAGHYVREASDCWQRVVETVEDVEERIEAMNEYVETENFEAARTTYEETMNKLTDAREFLDDATVATPEMLDEQIDHVVDRAQQAAVRKRLRQADRRIEIGKRETQAEAYIDAYHSYCTARDHLETARTTARDAQVPEPDALASKLDAVESGLAELRARPLQLAREARERAEDADDLEAAVEAWHDAFERYRDVLTAGWGTDLEFDGDREEVKRETELVVGSLVEGHRELATRREQVGDERYGSDPTAAIAVYGKALEHLEKARALAAEFRAGSTAEIDAELGRVRRKRASERYDRLVDEVSERVERLDEPGSRSKLNLAVIAREAWRDVDSGEASLSVEGSMVFRGDKALLETLFEALYRNALTGDGDDATVRVDRTDEGFYVERDDGEAETPEDTVFEWGGGGATGGQPTRPPVDETAISVPGWSLGLNLGPDGRTRFTVNTPESKYVFS